MFSFAVFIICGIISELSILIQLTWIEIRFHQDEKLGFHEDRADPQHGNSIDDNMALGPRRSLRFSCQHILDAHDEWRMRPKRLSRSSSVPFWHSFVFFLADSFARSFGSPHNVHTKTPIYSLDTPLAFVWTLLLSLLLSSARNF